MLGQVVGMRVISMTPASRRMPLLQVLMRLWGFVGRGRAVLRRYWESPCRAWLGTTVLALLHRWCALKGLWGVVVLHGDGGAPL